MFKSTPRNIAILASAVMICTAYICFWFFSVLLFNESHHVIRLVASLTSGMVAYFFTRRVISSFLVDRIKHIYQLIYKQDEPRLENLKFDPDKPLLQQVASEVSIFVKTQKQEMNTLRDLERYRQDFVGNVAHELKTPLFNIQGYVHTLKEGAMEDPEVNNMYLQRTIDNVDRLIKIVEDLDSIYKMESNQLKLDWQPIDLHKFIESMIEELGLMAKEKSIQLLLDSDIEGVVWIQADADYLRQVFVNLIENSIKYGKIGGETKVKVLDLGTQVLIEIKDNGAGIEAKHLRHIFDRFYRVDKARSRQAGGSGLGLSIVKHIIEAHGQNIQIRSTFGSGSTFSFTLDKSNEDE